jgi:hypothetical protein
MKENKLEGLKIKHKANIIWREVDEEVVILNLENDKYYSMNQLGAQLWKMLKTKSKVKHIIDNLEKEYDVKRAVLIKDIGNIISELKKEDLIIIS